MKRIRATWLPLLIWSVIIFVSITGSVAAFKTGTISIHIPGSEEEIVNYDNPSYEQIETEISQIDPVELPTPQAETTKVVQVARNVNTPKYDGSRSGRIVDYYSYCERKNVKIYENELMYFKSSDGKTGYVTKTDYDCYERDLKKLGQLQYKDNTQYSNEYLEQLRGLKEDFYKANETMKDKAKLPADTILDCPVGNMNYRLTYNECINKQNDYWSSQKTNNIELLPIPNPSYSTFKACKKLGWNGTCLEYAENCKRLDKFNMCIEW